GDVLHDRAMIHRQLQRSLEILIDVAKTDPHVAAADAPARPQLRQHRAGAVDWHREPDAARSRADRGVDPDDLATRVDQWSTAVAEVDGRGGRDVVFEAHSEGLAA